MASRREQRTTPGGQTYYVKLAAAREPRGKARPAPAPATAPVSDAQPTGDVQIVDERVERSASIDAPAKAPRGKGRS